MSINLQILGMQAIPRLAKSLGVKVDFPPDAFQVSLQGFKAFHALLEQCVAILETWFEESHVSWWDVYLHSDIGLERMAIVRELLLDENCTLLDVGCGRGYFSIAAARLLKSVVGVDLMDGLGRQGWWAKYTESLRELDLVNKVVGVKADARRLPFNTGAFNVAASVHALRNFQDYASITAAIGEMKRVVRSGGTVVVVESLPVAKTHAQQAHLAMFRCKVKYTAGELDYPSKDRMLTMFENVGFQRIEVKELDYDWSAAPPIFSIDPYLPALSPTERTQAKRAFEKAATLVRQWGETSPPALLVEGIK